MKKTGSGCMLSGCLILGLASGCWAHVSGTVQNGTGQASPAAFAPGNIVTAEIRYTEFGVPHVRAAHLEGIGMGVGYAFSRDNFCLLADQVLRYNSRRAAFFGPGPDVDGDTLPDHLVSDFGWLALEIRAQAEAAWPSLSMPARALYSGYALGVNRYLAEVGRSGLDPQCANAEWVSEIDAIDLLTMSLGTALLAGSAQFLPALFVAAPPGIDPSPVIADSASGSPVTLRDWQAARSLPVSDYRRVVQPRPNAAGLASNGWALGEERSANGRGMVLANPHFPHTGPLRFYSFHATIPGQLNVYGASLTGMPGVVNIGFNEQVAWTHTFATSEHFVVYRLGMDASEAQGLHYEVDDEARTLQVRTDTIDVAGVGRMRKTRYLSDYGPLLSIPGALDWTVGEAFAIKDANANNLDIVDHWLAMNLAGDMNAFIATFQNHDGMLFNNTLAADREGRTFFIDDSAVPDLSDEALAIRAVSPFADYRSALEFTVLPATAACDFSGPVPFSDAPKLENNSFVQNSNESFWLTHPDTPITEVSPLFGDIDVEQSFRARLGPRMLSKGDPASGTDDRFSLDELVAVFTVQRNELSELLLPDLLSDCRARGRLPVHISFRRRNPVSGDSESISADIDLSASCAALQQFSDSGALMRSETRGAHLFREFARRFALRSNSLIWQNGFTAAAPLSTPNTLADNEAVLKALAEATWYVQQAGLALDAALGSVQFVERSDANGNPSGERLAWGGGAEEEGSFNVFRPDIEPNGTLLARHIYAPIDDQTALSAEAGGYHINYGSGFVYAVSFTDEGPLGFALNSLSQARDPRSPQHLDQSRLYSSAITLRPIRFSEADISRYLVETVSLSVPRSP